jgi:acyl-coenzyme A synthetase/AMP-(fatty) acid ligase/acyl carrier protein
MRQEGGRPLLKLTDQLEKGQFMIGLSGPQMYIFRAQALSQDPGAYVASITLELAGCLDITSLADSVRDLYAIHPALRGYVSVRGPVPSQGLISLDDVPQIQTVACSDTQRARLRAEAFTLPVDHNSEFRAFGARLFTVSGAVHYLALRFHHLFVDGPSIKIVARDLERCYELRTSGAASQTRLGGDTAYSYFDWLVTEQLCAAAEGFSPAVPSLQWVDRGDMRLQRGEDFRTIVTLDQPVSESLNVIGRDEELTGAAVWLAAASILSTGLDNNTRTSLQVLTHGRYRSELIECVGCFTTPVVVQIDLDPASRFVDVARAADKALAESIGTTVNGPPCEEVSVTVLYRRANEQPVWKVSDMTVTELRALRRSARSPLQIGVVEAKEGTQVRFELGRSFSSSLQRSVVETFTSICRNIARNPTRASVNETRSDRAGMTSQTMSTVAGGGVDRGRSQFIEMLHTLAARKSSATALIRADDVFNATPLTYSEVVGIAHLIACRLRKVLGGESDGGVVIGVEARNGIEYVITCLAIIVAGFTFKPVMKPTSGKTHIAAMVDCDRLIVFDDAADLSVDTSVICYDDLIGNRSDQELLQWPALCVSLCSHSNWPDPKDDIMCVITTSGSTGKPKAVPISYSSVMNRLNWMWDRYPATGGEQALVRTSPLFVDSLWEMFGPLLVGVSTVTLSGSPNYSLRGLAESVSRFGITRMSITPSLLSELLLWTNGSDALCSIRVLIVSGEILLGEILGAALRHMPTAVVLNLYGSTETAGDATAHECIPTDVARHVVPVGVPLPGVKVRIVGDQQRPLLPAMVGEVLVGGRCLTGAAGSHGEAWLRSGDLGYMDRDGKLTVTGRCDDLVKVNGILISLPAIEQQIYQFSGGAPVRVAATRSGKLVAFYEDGALNDGDIRDINERLQDSHRPSWKRIQRLPRTSTGKISRKEIQRLVDEDCSATAYESMARIDRPHTHDNVTEDDIVHFVLAMKGHDFAKLEPDENLVRVGLNSMDIIRLIGIIERQFNARINPEVVFANPTALTITAELRHSLGVSVDEGEDKQRIVGYRT